MTVRPGEPMPKELSLPAGMAAEGWKLKIRDREIREPPHVTLIRGTTTWRWDLRSRAFMDRRPSPRDIPDGVVPWLREHHHEYVDAWDELYPGDPVGRTEDE